jgi:hypothetical protein
VLSPTEVSRGENEHVPYDPCNALAGEIERVDGNTLTVEIEPMEVDENDNMPTPVREDAAEMLMEDPGERSFVRPSYRYLIFQSFQSSHRLK